MSLFRICVCTISAFTLYGEYVVRSSLPDDEFFYLVTTGWIFDISLLCDNSINQFNQPIKGEIGLLVISKVSEAAAKIRKNEVCTNVIPYILTVGDMVSEGAASM